MKFHQDGTLPNQSQIFVFGSNLRGAHGAGAARVAHDKYHASMGVSYGMTGRAFAIPTKDFNIITMDIKNIIPYINRFVSFTKTNNHLEFFVTRIGCGLAGYDDKDIAPLFKKCGGNCSFALQWKDYLTLQKD